MFSDDRQTSNGELWFLVERLIEALCDVLRIAESRGGGRCVGEEDLE